jgi:predicted transcriptional regulator
LLNSQRGTLQQIEPVIKLIYESQVYRGLHESIFNPFTDCSRITIRPSTPGRKNIMAIRTKNITIGIQSLDEGLSDIAAALKARELGEKVSPRRGVYFENLDAFRKILTEKRLELLHVVKRDKPDTIHELSRLLGRDVKNVSDDLKYLSDLGLVSLDKSAHVGEGRRISPRVRYEKIRLEISI